MKRMRKIAELNFVRVHRDNEILQVSTHLLVDLRERVDEDDCLLDVHVLDRAVLVVRLHALHVGERVQAADQFPEHGVLPVEVLAGPVRDETGGKIAFLWKNHLDDPDPHSQLRLVGVRPRVRHAQDAPPGVREVLLDLVLEGRAPKGFASRAVAFGITALNLDWGGNACVIVD